MAKIVVDGTASDEDIDLSVFSRRNVKREIADLEAQITPRRMREALLTAQGLTWLNMMEAQIAALRAQL